MQQAITIPSRLKLDNAANIYPASMSKSYSSLYRIRLSMSEDIEAGIMQKALERVSERIPTFRCTLKAGGFWWYLDRVESKPVLRPLKPLKQFNFKEQDGLLYRVSVEGSELYLDVFHALADGNGALCFIMTLAGEYIRLRHGVSIDYNSLVWNPSEKPIYSEVEDSFGTYFGGRHGQLEKNADAYHIRGAAMPCGKVDDLRVVMPQDRIKQVCKDYDCTVTELLTAAMLYALQAEHNNDPSAKKRSVLKVSVPVNLRPIYGSRTVRNFSSYVNLGIDVKDGYMDFPAIVRAVRAQKAHDTEKSALEPKIAANVELEEMLIVKCLPLFVKHPIIDYINLHHGDRFVSQTLSNIGNIKVPQQLMPYITDVDFMLGKQRGNSGAVSCLGYNGKIYLHMTRKISRDGFERAFLQQIWQLGIPFETSLDSLA